MPANLWKKCKFCDRESYTEGLYCPICKMRLDGTLEMMELEDKNDSPPFFDNGTRRDDKDE
jgi:hypothetical protein